MAGMNRQEPNQWSFVTGSRLITGLKKNGFPWYGIQFTFRKTNGKEITKVVFFRDEDEIEVLGLDPSMFEQK